MTVEIDRDAALEVWRQAQAAAPNRKTVSAPALVEAAAAVLRSRGISMQPTQFVTNAVRLLEADGVLTLPSAKTASARRENWDNRCLPPLPCFVRPVPTEAAPVVLALRKEHPWHPELAFLAAEARLCTSDVWLAIDAWLKKRGGDDDVMSMRERSYEIFGDEKKLDRVKCCKAFTDGTINLAQLRCHPVPEPLVARVCPDLAATRAVLVVENKDTFKSACIANARFPLFSAVIFGEGGAFPGRVGGLADLAEEAAFDTVRYYGDIDAKGFDIARQAEAAIGRESPFRFAMAAEFYLPLIAAAHPTGVFGRTTTEMADFLARHGLSELCLNGKGRIPQEALARPAMLRLFEGALDQKRPI